MSDIKISSYLDHAVLKPQMSEKEVVDAIKLGIDYKVKTVCVMPCYIDLALSMCKDTETEVSCVVGFPHGVVLSEIKAEEAKAYIQKGIHEIDMVVNYSYIRSGEWELVKKDIESVTTLTRPVNVVLKVILETAMLTPDEIVKATETAIEAKADFVKTSTGFNGSGATQEAVKIMLETSNGRIKVKASGGIREAIKAKMFIDMGCHRLGNSFSSTPVICDGIAHEAENEGDY